MKLNKTRLKQLIQEELQAALSELTDEERRRGEEAHAKKEDMESRAVVARVVKEMDAPGYIVSQLMDLVGAVEDEAKLRELTGVTVQDLRKVMALNQKIEDELSPILTQMQRQVAANKAGVTPSPYGKTEKRTM